MPSLTVLDHPLAGDLLTRLRDRETGPADFRSLDKAARRALLVVEATRDLPTEPVDVQTPLEPFEGAGLARDLVAIPVLRAGLGLLDAVTTSTPTPSSATWGWSATRMTHEPRDYYAQAPADGRAPRAACSTRCSRPAGRAPRRCAT